MTEPNEQKVRLIIFGSCVSRDILNFAEGTALALSDYYARSSIASLATPPFSLDEKYLAQIKSDFQRRMVSRDLGKIFTQEIIERSDFDFILLDLIDERFDLYEISPGTVVTISSEFLSTRFLGSKDRSTDRWIRSGSERHRALWQEGIERLFKTLERHGLSDRVIVNKVFWSDRLEDGTMYPESDISKHHEANQLLNWMYGHLEAYVSPSRWLSFPDELLRSVKTHRWGLAPFHYSNKYYTAAASRIQQLCIDRQRDGAILSERKKVIAWSEISPEISKRTCFMVFKDQELIHTQNYSMNGEMHFDTGGASGNYKVVILTLTYNPNRKPGDSVRRKESSFDLALDRVSDA